jgi:hypothetical protein
VFRALIAIFICLFASGASTEPSVEDKLCIFSAAQKLPAIPGLEITSSRVKSLPPEQRRPSRENAEGLIREGRNRYQSRRSGRDVRVRLLRCARRHRVRNPNRSVRSLSSRKLPGATNRRFAS